MSHRVGQVESTLHRALQEVISRGFHDPRIRGMITVTRVDAASDLKTATVFVSVLPKEHQALSMHGIRDASKHIRRRVGELVRMKNVPTLTFKPDLGIERQAQVFEALAKIEQERADEEDRPEGTEAES